MIKISKLIIFLFIFSFLNSCTSVVELSKSSVNFNIAEYYQGKDDYESAIKYFNRARMLLEDDFECTESMTPIIDDNIGYSYFQLNEFNKSLEYYNYCYDELLNSSIEYLEEKERKKHLEIYNYWIGENNLKLGNCEEAIAYFTETLKYNETAYDAMRELAYSYLMTNNLKEAEKYFKKSLETSSSEEIIKIDEEYSKENIEIIEEYLKDFPEIRKDIFSDISKVK